MLLRPVLYGFGRRLLGVGEGIAGRVVDGPRGATHARIEPRPDGAWVDDLGSTNGTFLNGKKLKRAKLAKAGDVIKIGATELQVQS